MSVRSMKLKKRWQDKELTYGAWMTIGSVPVAEILASSGLDFVFIDTEHTAIDYDTLQNLLAAFSGAPTVPIVRVPWNDSVMIKRALDIGADGILAPMVRTVEETQALVSSCKYPPDGTRGFGPFRATNWLRDIGSYVKGANKELIVIPQLEHVDTLPIIDQVVAVSGVDAVCLGPADISGSLGVLLQLDHPTVQDALMKFCDAAERAGLPTCMALPFPPDVQSKWISRGARMLVVATDCSAFTEVISTKLTALKEAAGATSGGAKLQKS